MGVWRARVEGRLAWVIVFLRPALVPASHRWATPRGGRKEQRRATMASRGIAEWMSGLNTASRRFSKTSGHSALIVENRAARIT